MSDQGLHYLPMSVFMGQEAKNGLNCSNKTIYVRSNAGNNTFVNMSAKCIEFTKYVFESCMREHFIITAGSADSQLINTPQHCQIWQQN